MPTHIDKNAMVGRSVPDKPKSFSPEIRDSDHPNAWDGLRALSDRGSTQPSRQDEMIALARGWFEARRIRNKHLPESMFGEPSWDMLLWLYINSKSGARQTISNLSETSGAPATTALRWIRYLERLEFAARRPNPMDNRVVFIEITDRGAEAVGACLTDLLEQRTDFASALPVKNRPQARRV